MTGLFGVRIRTSVPTLWLAVSVLAGIVICAGAVAFLWPDEPLVKTVVAGRAADLTPSRPLCGEGYCVTSPRGDPIALKLRTAHGQLVRFCAASGWFQDDRGNVWNEAGEVRPGSAVSQGLPRYEVSVTAASEVVVRFVEHAGPRGGVDSVRRAPSGPNCDQ